MHISFDNLQEKVCDFELEAEKGRSMSKWLLKIYCLYMKGAKANHFPIRQGLLREKEWKAKPQETK